jgi:hypothetical protein
MHVLRTGEEEFDDMIEILVSCWRKAIACGVGRGRQRATTGLAVSY